MKKNQVITKWTLYKNAIQSAVAVGIIFGLLLVFMFFLSVLLSSTSPFNLGDWQESLFPAVFAFILIVGSCSISPLYGIFRLTKQEKSLNFSFSDEMKKYNITNTNYENHQWFTHTKGGTILVIHRDYIQEIKNIYTPNNRGSLLVANVIKFDDKKMKILGSHETILRFENWFLQK